MDAGQAETVVLVYFSFGSIEGALPDVTCGCCMLRPQQSLFLSLLWPERQGWLRGYAACAAAQGPTLRGLLH